MKKHLKIMLVILTIGIMIGALPVSAKAAKLVCLNSNKTYKSYDFTRDGKADRFKYVVYRSGVTKLYLNGKYKQEIPSAKGATLYWCKFSKKNTFLLEHMACFGGHNLIAYKYSGGRFKKIGELYSARFDYGGFEKVKGNILYIGSNPRTFHTKSFEHMGGDNFLTCITKYKISNGKLKLVSRKADATGYKTFYSRQSFRTSANADKLGKKNGPYVKKGQKVTLKKIYFPKKGGYVYGIKVGNKMGWFKDSAKIQFTLRK